MKTDYITSTPTLPPHLVYPRFLLGLNVRLTAKEVYAIMLDIRRCLEQLKLHGDLVAEFDASLWGILVESVTVFTDNKLTFLFRDGTKISSKLPENK